MYEVDQYTVSLLHFEDGLKDECGRKWVSNNAVLSTDQKKFGNSSLAVDVGKYIYTDEVSDFDFTGQFTIEMWVMFTKYPTNHGGNFAHAFFSQFKDINNSISVEAGSLDGNSIPGINFDSISGGARITTAGSYSFNLNKWYHVAFVADGLDSLYIFVNGKLLNREKISTQFPLLNSTRACIGKLLYTQAEYDCIGYIDEVRISNIARWTSDFNPELPQPSTEQGLLRITMNDSSEREYRLSLSEIDDFVKWFNRTIGTGTTGYVFNKAVQKSKEYLSFEKIISFEVIPLKD